MINLRCPPTIPRQSKSLSLSLGISHRTKRGIGNHHVMQLVWLIGHRIVLGYLVALRSQILSPLRIQLIHRCPGWISGQQQCPMASRWFINRGLRRNPRQGRGQVSNRYGGAVSLLQNTGGGTHVQCRLPVV